MNAEALLALGILASQKDFELIARRIKEFKDTTGIVHIYFCICEAKLANPASALKKLAQIALKLKLPCSLNVARLVINMLQDIPDPKVLGALKTELDATLQLAELNDLLLAAQLSMNFIGTKQATEILSAAQAQLPGLNIGGEAADTGRGAAVLSSEEQMLLSLLLQVRVAESVSGITHEGSTGMLEIARHICQGGEDEVDAEGANGDGRARQPNPLRQTATVQDTATTPRMNPAADRDGEVGVGEESADMDDYITGDTGDDATEDKPRGEGAVGKEDKNKTSVNLLAQGAQGIVRSYNSPNRPYLLPIASYSIALLLTYCNEVEEAQKIFQTLRDAYGVSNIYVNILSCLMQRRLAKIISIHSDKRGRAVTGLSGGVGGEGTVNEATENSLDELENEIMKVTRDATEERQKYSLKKVSPVDLMLLVIRYTITGQGQSLSTSGVFGSEQNNSAGATNNGAGSSNQSVDDTLTLVEPVVNAAVECFDPISGLEALDFVFNLVPGDVVVLQRIVTSAKKLYDNIVSKGSGEEPEDEISKELGASDTRQMDIGGFRQQQYVEIACCFMVKFLFWTGNFKAVIDITRTNKRLSSVSTVTLSSRSPSQLFSDFAEGVELFSLPTELLVLLAKIKQMPMKDRIEASRVLESCFTSQDFDEGERGVISPNPHNLHTRVTRVQLVSFAALLSLLTDGRMVSILAMAILTIPLDSCSSDSCLFALQELVSLFSDQSSCCADGGVNSLTPSRMLFRRALLSSDWSSTTSGGDSSRTDRNQRQQPMHDKMVKQIVTTSDFLTLSPYRLVVPSTVIYKLFEESDLLFDVNKGSPRLQSITKYISLDEIANVSWALYLQAPPPPLIRLQLAALSPVPVALKLLSNTKEVGNVGGGGAGGRPATGGKEDFTRYSTSFRERRECMTPLMIAEHLYLSSIYLRQTNAMVGTTSKLSDLTKGKETGDTAQGKKDQDQEHQEFLNWMRKQIGWNWARGNIGIADLGPAKTHLGFAKIKGYGLLGGREGKGVANAMDRRRRGANQANPSESITGLAHEQYWPWVPSSSSKLMEYSSDALKCFSNDLELTVLREEGRWLDVVKLLSGLVSSVPRVVPQAGVSGTQTTKDNGLTDKPRLDSGLFVGANGYSTNTSGGYSGFNQLEVWFELLYCQMMVRDSPTGAESLFSDILEKLSPQVLNGFMVKIRILLLKLLVEHQRISETKLDEGFTRDFIIKVLRAFPKAVKMSESGTGLESQAVSVGTDVDIDLTRDSDRETYKMLQQTVNDYCMKMLKDSVLYDKCIEEAHIPQSIRKESHQLRTSEEIETVGDEMFVKGRYNEAIGFYVKAWTKKEEEEERHGRGVEDNGGGTLDMSLNMNTSINTSIAINSKNNLFARMITNAEFIRLGRKVAECFMRLYKHSYAQKALKEALLRSVQGVEETKVIVGQEEFLSEYVAAHKTLLQMKMHNGSWRGAYKLVSRLLGLFWSKYGLEGCTPSMLRGIPLGHLADIVFFYTAKADIFWNSVELSDRDVDPALTQNSNSSPSTTAISQTQSTSATGLGRTTANRQTAATTAAAQQQSLLEAFYNKCGVSYKVFSAMNVAILFQQNGVLTQMRSAVNKGAASSSRRMRSNIGPTTGLAPGGLDTTLAEEYKNLGNIYYRLAVYHLKLMGNTALPDNPENVIELNISELSDVTLDRGRRKVSMIGVLSDDTVDTILKTVMTTIEDGLNECPSHVGLLVLKIVVLHNHIIARGGEGGDTNKETTSQLKQECERCCDRLIAAIPGHPFPYTVLAEMKLNEGEINKATAILIQGLFLASGKQQEGSESGSNNVQIISAENLERIVMYNIRSGTIAHCASILGLSCDSANACGDNSSGDSGDPANANPPPIAYTRGIVFRSIQSNTDAAHEIKIAIKSNQLSQKISLNAFWLLSMSYIQPEVASFLLVSNIIYSTKRLAPAVAQQSKAFLTQSLDISQQDWLDYKGLNDPDSKLGKKCKNLFAFQTETRSDLIASFSPRTAKLEKAAAVLKRIKSGAVAGMPSSMVLAIEGYLELSWCVLLKNQICLVDKMLVDAKILAQQQKSANINSDLEVVMLDGNGNKAETEGKAAAQQRGKDTTAPSGMDANDTNSLTLSRSSLEKLLVSHQNSLNNIATSINEPNGSSSGTCVQHSLLAHIHLYLGDLKRAGRWANEGISGYADSMPSTVYLAESQVYCAGIKAVADFASSPNNSTKFFPNGWWATGIPIGGCAVWKHLVEGLIYEHQEHYKTAAEVYETLWAASQFIPTHAVGMSDDNWYRWHLGYRYSHTLLRARAYQKCVSVAQCVLRDFPMYRKLRSDILAAASEHLFDW